VSGGRTTGDRDNGGVNDRTTHLTATDEHYLEIMSALGHELRRPLTVIRGAATLMLDMAGRLSPDKTVNLLSLIDGNVEEMSDLIEDLLLTVHLEAGDLRLFQEPVDVAEMVAMAVEAERRHTGDHPVTVLGAAPGLQVVADRDRAVRALRALIDNAARHSPPEASIEITVAGPDTGAQGGTGVRAKSARPRAQDHAHVRFEVRDQGPGIPAADRARAFERFEKLAGGTGLGLGLYLVEGLARVMGGDAGAGDAAGGGAVVWFTLRRRG
jgi:two-component system, OmpR family, sensor kinase